MNQLMSYNKANIKLYCLFIFLIVSSCNNENITRLTDSEKLAINKVLELYGGEVNYSKGIDLTENNKNYFEISLTNSEVLKDYENYKYLPASNIALILFSKSNLENQFDTYKVNIDYSGGAIKSYEFSKERLSVIKNSLINVEKIINNIKNRDYNSLIENIEVNNMFSFDKNSLINGLKIVDEQYGIFLNKIITGFTYNTTNSDLTFIKIYGVIKRSKKDNLFTIYVDEKTKKVFFIEYKWEEKEKMS